MKLSVSLAEGDIEFLDAYAESHAVSSRSAAIQAAVALLRSMEMADDYAAAWAEWENSADAESWDSTVADGLPER